MSIYTEYIQLGFTHVVPFGYDHILFILSLYLLSSNLREVLIQCSVFTISHSFALAASALGYIFLNPNVVEPLIAISILYSSIENIANDKPNNYRLLIIFLFGLIHGLGFSFALNQIILQQSNFKGALFSFNLGVEIGQIAVIIAAHLMLGIWFKEKIWYKRRIVYPLSTVIGSIALVISIIRIMELF